MTYRIPYSDVCMSDAMPFNQHWEARVGVPIAALGDFGAALQSAGADLRIGDRVMICSFDKQGDQWRRLRELAEVRIVDIVDRRLFALQERDTVFFPTPTQPVINDEFEELSVIPVLNSWEVRDRAGNVIEQFAEEQQAREFADRENDRPKPVGIKSRAVKRGKGNFQVVDKETGDVIETFRTKADAEAFASA